jgi:hypothetical protein
VPNPDIATRSASGDPTAQQWLTGDGLRGRDPLTGRTKWISRQVNGSRREAERAERRLMIEVADGRHEGSKAATMRELLHQWIEDDEQGVRPFGPARFDCSLLDDGSANTSGALTCIRLPGDLELHRRADQAGVPHIRSYQSAPHLRWCGPPRG